MSLDIYFRQHWTDARLQFGSRDDSLINDTKIVGGREISEQIWTPDTFFVNERSSSSKECFVRLLPSGSVLWSQRISVTVVNYAILTDFPWDTQESRIELESFGQTTAGIDYSWKMADRDTDSEINSAQISFTALARSDMSVVGHNVARVVADLPSGNYSRLIYTVFVTRNPGFCTHSVFLPVALVSLHSLVSLLLPARDTTSRTLVLSLTSLAMLAYKTWLHTSLLPGVTYATRATVYLDLHLAIVLLAVLHLVLGLLLQPPSLPPSSLLPMEPLERQDSLASGDPILRDPKVRAERGRLVARICGGLLPVVFLVGQAVFWLSVLHLPDTQGGVRI